MNLFSLSKAQEADIDRAFKTLQIGRGSRKGATRILHIRQCPSLPVLDHTPVRIGAAPAELRDALVPVL